MADLSNLYGDALASDIPNETQVAKDQHRTADDQLAYINAALAQSGAAPITKERMYAAFGGDPNGAAPVSIGLDPSLYGGSKLSAQQNIDYLNALGQQGYQSAIQSGAAVANQYAGLTQQQAQQYADEQARLDYARQTQAAAATHENTLGSAYANAIKGLATPAVTGTAEQVAAANGLLANAAGAPTSSVVESQLGQTQQGNLQQALAALGSGRGGAAGQAQNAALTQSAAANQAAVNQASMQRAAEDASNRQASLQAYGAAAQLGAGLQGQQLTGAQLAVQQQQAAAQAQLGYVNAGMGYNNMAVNTDQMSQNNLANYQQMQQLGAGTVANAELTAAQQAFQNQIGAVGMQQQQLSLEDQLRINAMNAENSKNAGLGQAWAGIQQQENAQTLNAIGTGLTIGAAALA